MSLTTESAPRSLDPAPPAAVIGTVRVHSLTLGGALYAIERLVREGEGGAVFTPNVDHVVLAEEDPRLRQAYARASLSLADGMPILWASRLLGTPLPEKVSGSDLVPPLLDQAAARGWRVYFLGAAPGVAESARAKLLERLPHLQVVGVESPRIDVDDRAQRSEIVARIRSVKPHLVFVALGAPKQEIWIDRARDELRPSVLLGVGASLDFVAGTIPRCPPWLSSVGLEWAFRLSREPKRLWRRYLVRDPKFLLVVRRALRERDGTVSASHPSMTARAERREP